jgi:phosphoglycolate phosphatase-like HAD superfamily hydrolase
MVAVVDIDGVVADVRHRLHHLTDRPQDWARFFAAAGSDPLLPEGRETVRTLAQGYDIHWLSGRPERLRDVTEQWLRHHELPEGPVRLRPDGDSTPSRRYKVDALHAIGRTRTIGLLVGDDPGVLEAAREAGYDVLPATWMGEHPSLRAAQEREGRT